MKKLVLGSLLLLSVGVRPVLAEEVRTLPPEVYKQMKKLGKLDQVWINPKYDAGTGFTLGRVTTAAEGYYANTIDYVQVAFQRLAVPGSTNVLNVTVTEMTTVDHGFQGYFSAAMGVEGEILDQDGQLMAAFSTKAKVENRQTVLDNVKGATDKVVWALSRDLGPKFQHTIEIKSNVVRGLNPSGLVPPAPAPAEQGLDLKTRLLRLEDLKQRGLITDDEYRAHKADILKGL
jgi:hypothetical protein